MYNLYQGNSGKVRRVEDNRAQSRAASAPKPDPRERRRDEGPAPGEARRHAGQRGPQAPPLSPGLPFKLPAQLKGLGELIPKTLSELESEDILLLLILYLMYRESGDTELLIIMGAMFLA